MSYLIMSLAQGTGSGPNHANVQLPGATFTGFGTFINLNDSVWFTFTTDGQIEQAYTGSSITHASPWWIPAPEASIGNSYELSFTVTSGSSPDVGGLSAGTWYPLTADRQIGLIASNPGIVTSGSYSVQIRDALTQTVRATGTYTVNAHSF